MNGIFYHKDNNSIHVISFFSKDNEVIGATFDVLDQELVNNFDRKNLSDDKIREGKYKINEKFIRFELTSINKESKVKYFGKIESTNEISLLPIGYGRVRSYKSTRNFPESTESLVIGLRPNSGLDVSKSISKRLSEFAFLLLHPPHIVNPFNKTEKKNNEKNDDIGLVMAMFEQRNYEYPLIYIPGTILSSILYNLSDNDTYSYLKINIPEPTLTQIPNVPSKFEFVFVEPSKIDYKGYGCLIQMVLSFIGWYSYVGIDIIGFRLSLIIIIICIVIIIGISFLTVKKLSTDKEVELSNDEYEKRMSYYIWKCDEIRTNNLELIIDFERKIHDARQLIKEKKERVALEVYYNSLKPTLGVVRKINMAKRGKTELFFLDRLFKKFGNQIKVDVALDINSQYYFPDFVFICNKTGLHIDIEIDEPYTLIDSSPIHYTESNDDQRNRLFKGKNWVVIRFSEKQIIQETDKCIEVIENTITSIQKKSTIIEHQLKTEIRWTYEEALVMAYNNERNKY